MHPLSSDCMSQITGFCSSLVSTCISVCLLLCHSLFPVDGKLCFTSCDILSRHDSVIFTSATLKFVPSLLCSLKRQCSSWYSFIVTIHFLLDFSWKFVASATAILPSWRLLFCMYIVVISILSVTQWDRKGQLLCENQLLFKHSPRANVIFPYGSGGLKISAVMHIN